VSRFIESPCVNTRTNHISDASLIGCQYDQNSQTLAVCGQVNAEVAFILRMHLTVISLVILIIAV